MDTYPILVKLFGIVGIASGLTVIAMQAAKLWPALKDATKWHPIVAIPVGLAFSAILLAILQPDLGTANHVACWMFVGVLAGFGGCGLYDVGHQLLTG